MARYRVHVYQRSVHHRCPSTLQKAAHTRAASLNSHTGLKDPQRSEWMPAVVQGRGAALVMAGAQNGVPRRLAQALTAGGPRGTEWSSYCLWKQSGAVLCAGSGQWFGLVCACVCPKPGHERADPSGARFWQWGASSQARSGWPQPWGRSRGGACTGAEASPAWGLGADGDDSPVVETGCSSCNVPPRCQRRHRDSEDGALAPGGLLGRWEAMFTPRPCTWLTEKRELRPSLPRGEVLFSVASAAPGLVPGSGSFDGTPGAVRAGKAGQHLAHSSAESERFCSRK